MTDHDRMTGAGWRDQTGPELTAKYDRLEEILRSMGKVAVAFSSGVDSTFLLKVAAGALGKDGIAVTALHAAVPLREQKSAVVFCQAQDIPMTQVELDVTQIPGFVQNPADRCYHCKKAIFTRLMEEACGYQVVEGSNMDDLGDYRPGMKAIRELGIRSPLQEAGLYKAEIRVLSEKLGLDTWNKPSFACLASRFAYGETIRPEGLKRVELAEEFLRQAGFGQYRVRVHGNLARIEVLKEDMDRLFAMRQAVTDRLKELGFDYVALDLEGFQTGSMNRRLGL